MVFFEDVLAARLGDGGALKPLSEKGGLLGDMKTKDFMAIPEKGGPNYPTAWLPTERVARAWKAMITETPFQP
jgi:hypothetical protein